MKYINTYICMVITLLSLSLANQIHDKIVTNNQHIIDEWALQESGRDFAIMRAMLARCEHGSDPR